MSSAPAWLIDKSALARLGISSDADAWTRRIEHGLVHIAAPTLLEVGYSARSTSDWYRLTTRPPVALMPVDHATPSIERRALEVQGLLAAQGHHRAPSVPDLLIAATAELNDLAVLHVGKDFDLIAAITGQAVELLTDLRR